MVSHGVTFFIFFPLATDITCLPTQLVLNPLVAGANPSSKTTVSFLKHLYAFMSFASLVQHHQGMTVIIALKTDTSRITAGPRTSKDWCADAIAVGCPCCVKDFGEFLPVAQASPPMRFLFRLEVLSQQAVGMCSLLRL